jgi:flavin-dependent dehydrogenase
MVDSDTKATINMNTYDYNIAIIGGGPAGSMASLYLSHFGMESCIIEKKKFPREVLCGEFLSCEVTSSLKHLNLFEKFLALSPIEINTFRGFGNRGAELFIPLNFPAYAIKRSVFDAFLLNEAKELGAKIYQPAEVQSVVIENDKFLLKIKGSAKSECLIRSNFLIAAYGKQSILDRKLDENIRNGSNIYNAIKFHLPNKIFFEYPQNDIRLYFGNNIYCGVNKVSSKETTLCLLEKRNGMKNSSRQRIIDLMKENENFSHLFKNGINKLLPNLPIYGTGNLLFNRREVVENGMFRIGDAAGLIAPLAGDGISMAFQSAEIISQLLHEHCNGKISLNQLSERYSYEWGKMFSKRLRNALLLQNIVMNNRLRNVGFKMIKPFPSLLRYLTETTRSPTEQLNYNYIW